ncbi:MAG: BrnT family toxin [Pseudomonadales bacterium]|nr:BrnT family toxin [Pseudomonadales bacterium]
MQFEWDEAKNTINIRKHGIDFADVTDMFNHPMLTLLDDREDYGEERWIGIGWMQQLVGVVVYVERHEDTIRIISARKATKHEVRQYEQSI